MSSAASRAAKTLGGSSRNRPSRSMSLTGGVRSSINTAATGTSGSSGGTGSTPATTGRNTIGGGGTSSYGTPSFMDHVTEQYESLSDKLARENTSSTLPSSNATSSLTDSKTKGASAASSSSSRKVRWAETAAIASTMDATNAANNNNDEDYVPRSPMDIISDLFTKKYTLPIFLLLTCVIFLMVHLAGSGGPNDDSFQRYSGGGRGSTQIAQQGGKGSRKFGFGRNRQQNRGGGDGFGDIIFSLTPTTLTVDESSMIPTIEVIQHSTPKISPTTAAGLSPSAVNDGNEPGWIVVPTQSGVFLTSDANAGGDGNGGGTPDAGSPTTLKWQYGAGQPTPDPALLVKRNPDDGSPTSLKWNLLPGAPTPDPALLGGPDKGSPTTLVWNYPPGLPTPNPALLIEVAPPAKDDGSPTTLKWGGLQQVPLAPRPSPTVPEPSPGGSTEVAGPVDPDAGSPTTLKWKYPPGEPTPDPALLLGVPDQMVWGYPPGMPTPDPALLTGGIDTPQIEWGYPPGVPTPDPALLTGTNTAVSEPVGWGYPEGEPTPDPALLNGVPRGTVAPTKRNVETRLVPPTKYPTRRPTRRPTGEPTPVITESPLVTLKVVDISPPAPRPSPKAPKPKPKTPDQPAEVDEEEPQPTPKPVIPPPPLDYNGNEIELSPPEPQPRPPRAPRPQNNPPPPAPKVNVQPYNGPGGYTYGGSGQGTDPYYNGPNGFTIPQNPQQDGQPQMIYQGNGGVVIPQMQSCGCCCCNCGGGGGMANLYVPQGFMPQMQGGAVPISHIPLMGAPLATDEQIAPSDMPGCPWDCVIDENVPSMGRSNEDDALYEIFYTNPLNCCGTIVEIGAGGGKEHSTSYFFENGMNWTTYLTEADPVEYAKIADNRKGDKVKAINGAFCKEGPFLYFDESSRNFLSAAEDDYASEPMAKFDTSSATPKVNCIRLDTILADIDHVDVMVIRVRGDPWAVLRTMDWDIQVDIWVILMQEKEGLLHDTIRAALKLHDYVPAAWDIKLWCDGPENCMPNEVYLRKNFNPINKPLFTQRGLRGSNGNLPS